MEARFDRSVATIIAELETALRTINRNLSDKNTTLDRLTECQQYLDRIKTELGDAVAREQAALDQATNKRLEILRQQFDATQTALTAAIHARGKIEHASPFLEADESDEEATRTSSRSRKRTDRDALPRIDDTSGLLAPRKKTNMSSFFESFDDDDDDLSRARDMDLLPENDDTFDEDEEEENIAEEHFFATTVKEFEDKAKELKAFNHKELEEHLNIAGKLLLACENMEDSASTPQQRKDLVKSIKHQLEQFRKIQGFLSDCLSLDRGDETDRSNVSRRRDPALLAKYSGTEKITSPVIVSVKQRFADCIEKLQNAKRLLSSMPESGPTRSVFYSNLNEAVTCASFQEAKDRATAFLKNRGPIDPTALVIEASKPVIDPTAVSQFRFIATEVDSNAGKQAVAIIQETNASKSYSKQTVLTPGNTIANLKKASHDDQMKFVAHLIETQLASITTNGPIRISRNWDAKLALAAATYAKAMDYDFQPKEWLAKVKARDVEDYLMKNKNEAFMLEAIARRDAKNNTVSSPRFRR